jgi:HEAT repeat protein/GTPase SAR1 family protein
MEDCYINLALTERYEKHTEQLNGGGRHSPLQISPFSLEARLKVEVLPNHLLVTLPTLFDPRNVSDGGRRRPSRILMQGRAGVGKTTLCKKIVHDFIHQKMWNDKFQRIIWVHLRDLKTLQRYNLSAMLEHIFFPKNSSRDCFDDILAQEIDKTNSQDTLFLLDGLDEVSDMISHGDGDKHPGHDFLASLLDKPNVIITTRPQTALPSKCREADLELDTIGFSQAEVDEYIAKTIRNPRKGEAIRGYLRKNRVMQSLMRIPIQLDALCFTWDGGIDSNIQDGPKTMTGVYKAISLELWRKDIDRLGKGAGTKMLPIEIESSVLSQSKILEQLAFSGLRNNVVEFQDEHLNCLLETIGLPDDELKVKTILDDTSFLRSSSPFTKSSRPGYHFIHLTFQEYFAAKYLVKRFKDGQTLQCMQFDERIGERPEMTWHAFFQENKYDSRYDVVWRFVAGLLDVEKQNEIVNFFDEIQSRPTDLLGPTHQRLIMHCLEETVCHLPRQVRENLEDRLSQWLQFECAFRGSALLASEPEYPDRSLQMALKSCDDTGKSAIVRMLGATERHLSRDIIVALIPFLRQTDGDIRYCAAKAMVKQSDLPESAIIALVQLLQDENSNLQTVAAEIISAQLTLPKSAATQLVQILEDEKRDVQSHTANTLSRWSKLREPAITALIPLLRNERSEVRSAAAGAFGMRSELPDSTIIALVPLLQDARSDVQSVAAAAIGRQSELSESAATALVLFLQDERSEVRAAAAKSVDGRSKLPESAIETLVQLLQDGISEVRSSAARAISNQSQLSESVAKQLVQLLQDQRREVRSNADTAISTQSKLSEAVIMKLLRMLQEKRCIARTSVLHIIQRQCGFSEPAVVALLILLQHEDSLVRLTAAGAISKQRIIQESVVRALDTLLKDEDQAVRLIAAEVIYGHSKTPGSAMHASVVLLHSKDQVLRSAAIQAVISHSDLPEPAVMDLVPFLQHESDMRLRDTAARAMIRQSTLPDSAVMALIPLLVHKHANVRSAAALSIGKPSSLPRPAVMALLAQLQHGENGTRSATAKAIARNSNILDQILHAVGAVLISDDQTVVRRPSSCYSSFIECFYESLLWRSFSEQSCLCLDGRHFYIDRKSGLRKFSYNDSSVGKSEITLLKELRGILTCSQLELWGSDQVSEV